MAASLPRSVQRHTNGHLYFVAAPATASLSFIDYPSGDLTKTAIASIAASESDNNMYIITGAPGWATQLL